MATEEKQKKKAADKKRAHKKMMACDTLEKCRRAKAREGLPLEASPSMEDDDDGDDDEGMEVWLGFSPEAGLWSEPASAGPSGSAGVLKQGLTSSLPEVQSSARPDPIPVVAEEAVVMEEIIARPTLGARHWARGGKGRYPTSAPATGPRRRMLSSRSRCPTLGSQRKRLLPRLGRLPWGPV